MGIRPTAVVLLTLGLTLGVTPASQAAVTIGQTPPAVVNPPVNCNSGPQTWIQRDVSSGPGYVVPDGGGVITEWQASNGATANDAGALVVTTIAGNSFTVVAQTAESPLAVNTLNRFPVRIPVAGAEHIGVSFTSAYPCIAGTPSLLDSYLERNAVLSVGATVINAVAGTQDRVNISATVEPDADHDGFGDETQDVAFTSGPKSKTSRRKAIFGLVGAASLECRLDKALFAPCTSPVKLKKLKPRKHTFRVHALAPTGELSPEAAYSWRVKK
jgi:hypothetical protein